MTKFDRLIERYSFVGYHMYSKTISEMDWGDEKIASEYLSKYFIAEEDYLKIWKPIQSSIFKNENIGLPEIVFEEQYDLMATRGGVLFEREDFEQLKICAKTVGDKYIVIIQNDFGKNTDVPVFKMKYPVDISWAELMSGNFISTVIFEMFENEYFVFSESAKWGRYSANDSESPLHIIGYKPEYSMTFRTQFRRSIEENEEVAEWLPEKYRDIIKW